MVLFRNPLSSTIEESAGVLSVFSAESVPGTEAVSSGAQSSEENSGSSVGREGRSTTRIHTKSRRQNTHPTGHLKDSDFRPLFFFLLLGGYFFAESSRF